MWLIIFIVWLSCQLENESIDGLKIGILQEGFDMEIADPAVVGLVKETIGKLAGCGGIVTDVSLPLHTHCKLRVGGGGIMNAHNDYTKMYVLYKYQIEKKTYVHAHTQTKTHAH